MGKRMLALILPSELLNDRDQLEAKVESVG